MRYLDRFRFRFPYVASAACLLAASLASSEASALTIDASDCNLGFKTSFNPGDAVCVTGELDVVPPGSFWGEAWVFAVPVGSANPFADASAGGPNYVIGMLGAGGFIDEYVWLPPLKPGSYEFVIDQYPFAWDENQRMATGMFNPAQDYRTGDIPAFTVTNAPIVYSVDPQKIKGDAVKGLEMAAGMYALAQTLWAIGAISGVLEVGELGGGAVLSFFVLKAVCKYKHLICPISYNEAVLEIGEHILEHMSEALTKHYGAIINDPPDPAFDMLVAPALQDTLSGDGPWAPGGTGAEAKSMVRVGQLLAMQASAYGGMLPTLEKLQGAQQAGSNLGMYRQAGRLKAYSDMAIAAGDGMLTELDALEATLSSQGKLDAGLPSGDIQTAIDQLESTGLSAEELANLHSFGLTDADIQEGSDIVKSLEVPPVVSPKALIDRARGTFQEMKPALLDLKQQSENVRAENEPYAFNPGPAVSLPPPASAAVGANVNLTASAVHFDPQAVISFDWDTDGDGAFDDGQGAQIGFVPGTPGPTVVSVRATDSSGNTDTAYATFDVAIANEPPEITAFTPETLAPFAEVGEKLAFHAEATDKDGDTVTLHWLVDGQEKATGPDFEFEMPDEEAHSVSVRAADTDDHSPDAGAAVIVRSAKWKGQTGNDGGGGAGNNSGGGGAGNSGGGGAGGGGGNGQGADAGAGPGGCSCRTEHKPTSGAALLGIALALALGARRRTRPRAPGSRP